MMVPDPKFDDYDKRSQYAMQWTTCQVHLQVVKYLTQMAVGQGQLGEGGFEIAHHLPDGIEA
jgi:hypothetical protein